jgi:hypothetical protein
MATATPPRTPTTSGETVAVLEAQLAAMRLDRDTALERLAALAVEQASECLSMPFDPMPTNYHENIILNINCRINTPQRLALRALFQGLYRTHATTADGKHIDLPVHAIQWLLENLKFSGIK